MALFISTTSSSGNFSLSYNSWQPAPPPPPYTGSYLPAVIHVFDLDVDFEKARVAEIESKVEDLGKQIRRIATLANSACTTLEKDVPTKVASLQNLRARLATLQAKLMDLRRAQQDTQDPDEDEKQETSRSDATETNETNESKDEPDSIITDHTTRAKVVEQELFDDLDRFKKASPEAKRLYMKIMNLVHENKYGKVEYLRELYDLANLARKNNDTGALRGILKMAQQYHSPQGKLAVINFLKSRRDALYQQYVQGTHQLQQVTQSPAYAIHSLLEQGNKDQALAVFNRILDAQHSALVQALQAHEFEYATLTGGFEDGSTTKTFTI